MVEFFPNVTQGKQKECPEKVFCNSGIHFKVIRHKKDVQTNSTFSKVHNKLSGNFFFVLIFVSVAQITFSRQLNAWCLPPADKRIPDAMDVEAFQIVISQFFSGES